MGYQVYRKNATLYILSDDGQEYMFNHSGARVFVATDKMFYISYDGIASSLRLGRYTDITDYAGDSFASHEDCVEYLSREVFMSELDVFLQDQTSNIIDYYIPIPKNVFTLAAIPVIGSYNISLVDATNVIVGDFMVIKEGIRAYQAQVLGKAVNVLTMDTPVDYDFTVNAIVESRIINLNVDGSITAVVADFKPPVGAILDINVINISMTSTSPMDDGLFGSLPALTRGLVFRKAQNGNGFISIFNTKTNGQLSQRMKLEYSTKAPSGVYGLRASKYMNGQEGNGVSLRLDGNKGESMQVLIQDNLTGLQTFQMTARGHIVER